tara:strand:+ start:1825 stop:2418 length:594 start_codon:yes stop_codon:yes gene_type:complete
MIDNFIGVFDNALSKEHCEDLIKVYEDCQTLNYCMSRQDMGKKKINQDTNLVFPSSKNHIKDEIFFDRIQPHVKEFLDIAWFSYAEYSKKYGILNDMTSHRFYDSVKIQKTTPTGGFHVWHCEHDGRLRGSRLLLVMCYLNDVEEGGETEFLYQSKRVKCKQGRIVICPSAFTHTHRGNPPLTGDKYMINGWIEFDS